MEKADIIIPVYKPDGKFLTLIEKLGKQSVLPNRIIIMNTDVFSERAPGYGRKTFIKTGI